MNDEFQSRYRRNLEISASILAAMKKNPLPSIWRRAFGYPIWTMDYDGTIRKSRMFRIAGGIVAVRKIYGLTAANEDGTAPDGSYVKKWWPR